MLRWQYDVLVHKPTPESGIVPEVLCIPDPEGGSPIIFVAPPPPRYTMIALIVKSWLRSIRSFMFSKGQPDGTRRSANGPVSAFPVMHNALAPGELVAITELQSPAEGSFPCVTQKLSSTVGVSETQLRDSAPSMTYGENNESIWATAIAVAFCRKKLIWHVALWEDMTDKACHFGSRACGSGDKFEDIVQEAVKLFEG